MKVIPQKSKQSQAPEIRASTVVAGSDPWEILIASAKAATLAEDRPKDGLTFTEWMERLGMPEKRARKHLDTLLAAGTVKTVPGMRVGAGGQLRATVYYVPVKPGAS